MSSQILDTTIGAKKSFADTRVGTLYYLSPEMIEDKPYNDRYVGWSALF